MLPDARRAAMLKRGDINYRKLQTNIFSAKPARNAAFPKRDRRLFATFIWFPLLLDGAVLTYRYLTIWENKQMDETKRDDDRGSIWHVFLRGFGYGLGVLGGAVAVLFLFPSVREFLERLAMSCFG